MLKFTVEPNKVYCSLLGAQASRLQVLKQEGFKVLLEPYCIAFEDWQAGRLRSQQGEVCDKPAKLNGPAVELLINSRGDGQGMTDSRFVALLSQPGFEHEAVPELIRREAFLRGSLQLFQQCIRAQPAFAFKQ